MKHELRLKIEDSILLIVTRSIVIFAAAATLYPFIYVLSSSVSSLDALVRGQVMLFPIRPNLESYISIFNNPVLWRSYYNTIWYAVVGTTLNIVFTIMAAYPLSRKHFFARNFLTFIVVFTMFFSGGMIPSFILVVRLGLFDTRWAMILPVMISAWNMIICRTFMQSTISEELLEAAKIEGCSEYRIVTKIVIPLSKPIIATLVIFYGVSHWNTFFSALLYLRNIRLQPLQLFLRRVLMAASPELLRDATVEMDYSYREQMLLFMQLKYAVIVVAILPIMFIYPFLQKYFVKGIMIGSLKG